MRRPPARFAIALSALGVIGIAPVASATTEPDEAASSCIDGLADDVTWSEIDFVDYDAARAAGLLTAADELPGFDPSDDNDRLAWQDLAVGRGLSLPWILEAHWSLLRASTVGIADIRCSVWSPIERVNVFRLTKDAEFDEAPFAESGFDATVAGDVLTVGAAPSTPDTSDAAPETSEEGSGDLGSEPAWHRAALTTLLDRAAFQGLVLAGNEGGTRSMGAAADGDGFLMMFVWEEPGATAGDLEQQAADAIANSSLDEEFDLAAATVEAADGFVVITVPVVGELADAMHGPVERLDWLLVGSDPI